MGMSSYTVGTMIPKGFTTRAVLIKNDGSEPYKVCAPYHWTWDEDDAVYYRDDIDGETMRFEVPDNGCKGLTLKLGYHRRTLVKIDYRKEETECPKIPTSAYALHQSKKRR